MHQRKEKCRFDRSKIFILFANNNIDFARENVPRISSIQNTKSIIIIDPDL